MCLANKDHLGAVSALKSNEREEDKKAARAALDYEDYWSTDPISAYEVMPLRLITDS